MELISKEKIQELFEHGIATAEDWLRLADDDDSRLILLGFASAHIFSKIEEKFTPEEIDWIFNDGEEAKGMWN